MKEIYDWVPWFRELAEKIAKEGEDYLIKRAKQVEWGKSRALVEFGDEAIDPLSFFYFLASKNTRNQLKPVYASISGIFEIRPLDTDLDDEFYFPTPKFKILFHDGEKPNLSLLWRLFRQAMEDKPRIAPDAFMEVLNIQNVAVAKLTQALFLINPEFFLPVDDSYDLLSETRGFSTAAELQNEISEDGGYGKYQSFLGKIKEAFPGCRPYEINMFLYLIKPKTPDRIQLSGDFYQVSTYAHDPEGGDYWENRDGSFKENNWVFTGGQRDKAKRPYPLTSPKRGDTILVRTGVKQGRAIGIVYRNDYSAQGEWEKDLRIHVLWINKLTNPLSGQTTRDGFSAVESHSETYKAFRNTEQYRPSFDMIENLKTSPNGSEPETDPAANSQRLQDTRIHPLNQILYGPPGTGKTWNTVDYALAIIEDESVDIISKKSREGNLQRFNELKENGQIEMVTFHQNYNYEDFIEGIRPVLDDDRNGKVEYELVPGVFRRIVEAAKSPWFVDELLHDFAQSIAKRIESGEIIDLYPSDSRSGATIKKINWSSEGELESFQLGGTVKGQTLNTKLIRQYYGDFHKRKITSQRDIKPTRKSRSIEHGLAKYYFPLFQNIKDFHETEWQPAETVSDKKQNFVLIIDEINRGNIAKIFGELITLIEDSKRTGMDDVASVTLPYSKEEFGVPDNLYIIGTMNTADRSIALLDTALRRRFHFVEMMPDPELVPKDVGGVDCQKLLEAMNKRIRFLLDREHQIGHTYFMKIKDMDSLASTFQNQIMPLLQEYFYDNWEKIRMVLNKNDFIIRDKESERLRKDLLTRFPEHDSTGSRGLIDEQSKIYELLSYGDDKWKEKKSYINICDNGRKDDASETEQDA